MNDNAGPESMLAKPRGSSLPRLVIALSSVLSCVIVSVTGFMLIVMMSRFGIRGPGWATGIGNEESILSGVAFAGEVAAYGIFLIFITGPLTFFALHVVESGLGTAGRPTLRARVIGASRASAILFAILSAVVSMPHAVHTIIGAIVTSAALGALGGAFGGALLHLLSSRKKPAPSPETFK